MSPGRRSPYVHDLAKLLSLVEAQGEEVPPSVLRASSLTRFAVVSRYPGAAEPVDENDHREAVEVAGHVVALACPPRRRRRVATSKGASSSSRSHGAGAVSSRRQRSIATFPPTATSAGEDPGL